MAENVEVGVDDLLPVRSRISWGAILAGAMVALALYFLLTLLGAAVGLTVSGRVGPENIGSGAAVWAIAGTLLALFVGGYVTSQCTVGETKGEAALYGVILWGVLFGMLLWLTAAGVRSGFHAMVGMASAGEAVARDTSAGDWEAAAQQAGVPPETVAEWRRKAADAPDAARRAAADPQTQQAVGQAATRVAWWALLGTLLSMVAAVAGACVGAGPTMRLVRLSVARPRAGRPVPVGQL